MVIHASRIEGPTSAWVIEPGVERVVHGGPTRIGDVRAAEVGPGIELGYVFLAVNKEVNGETLKDLACWLGVVKSVESDWLFECEGVAGSVVVGGS